jgi:neutral ceramidase
MSLLRAGVGCADITPKQAVRLAGFLSREPAVPSLQVADRLQVRAVALEQAGTVALLLVLDLIGLSTGSSAMLRVAVAQATGVPVEQVLTSCTHTHSGPDTLLGMDLYDDYPALLTSAAVEAATSALASVAPVSVGVAEVDVPAALAVNRRGLPHAPRLHLVDLQAGDRRLASLVGVGIHPVCHGPDVHVVTADWVGHCRVAVEAALGGTAVVISGALGDVNPPGGEGYDRSGGGTALARRVGGAVAELAVSAAARTEGVGTALVLDHRSVELPVAGTETARLVSGGAASVVTELFDWAVGDLRLVSMPGEPLSAFAAAVRRPGPVLTVGLAPSWQGYLPHPDALDGGYEDELGLGAPAMRLLLDALGAA